MIKRWDIKEQGDEKITHHLEGVLKIEPTLANLLVQRGITTYDEAKTFFRPEMSQLHDPFLMKDMAEAVVRIEKAISKREKILVYGDYDVDGTTAVALVYSFFKKLYDNVDFYIPDRYKEGYGISTQGIDFAAKSGYKLVIALDCGIKAVDKIQYATDKGVDFIIGDHHRPGDEIPKAIAVLDAKRKDCNYPYKELSGCGVGFKLIQAYSQKNTFPFDDLNEYLDLVVVSIASDIVPITGENRILAYYGLQQINSNPRPGIEAILEYTNFKKVRPRNTEEGDYIYNRALTVSDLVFQIGPRINAAGRIESGRNSVELLISQTADVAASFAERINELNTERRTLDSEITEAAMQMIMDDDDDDSKLSTIVYNPDWSKGVIGIVASRLIESHYRPTIVFTKSNGLLTASCRSVLGFDIYDAIDSCSHLLEHFGGHKYAAGFSLKQENLEVFKQDFENYVKKNISEDSLTPEITIDASIHLNEINNKFYRILKQFAPFGPGNMAPIFLTTDVMDTGKARIVGKNHLKLDVVHANISGYPFPAIAFQQADKLSCVKGQGNIFSICYHLEENEWNGQKTLQLNIKDIRDDE
ncbi:MAG: single-stranded-DNA-specific exonuclease RecJ [Bacteroidetes bacterium 4572_77]|nr:MAG: single-stranded-DNA-specific exonuclease RecJ [Bacteroidetes bacterium 4572_77]